MEPKGYTLYLGGIIMKNMVNEVKAFAKEHKNEIGFCAFGIGCYGLGVILGRWSVYETITTYLGLGTQAGIEYAKANGLEAAETMVTTAYKIK